MQVAAAKPVEVSRAHRREPLRRHLYRRLRGRGLLGDERVPAAAAIAVGAGAAAPVRGRPLVEVLREGVVDDRDEEVDDEVKPSTTSITKKSHERW